MKREPRYFVLKIKDCAAALTIEEYNTLRMTMQTYGEKINKYRARNGKQPMTCVIVEDDWPMYEQVWGLIAAQVDKTSDSPPSVQHPNIDDVATHLKLLGWNDTGDAQWANLSRSLRPGGSLHLVLSKLLGITAEPTKAPAPRFEDGVAAYFASDAFKTMLQLSSWLADNGHDKPAAMVAEVAAAMVTREQDRLTSTATAQSFRPKV